MSATAFGHGAPVAVPAPPAVNDAHVTHERDKKRLRGDREGFDELLGGLGGAVAAVLPPPMPPAPMPVPSARQAESDAPSSGSTPPTRAGVPGGTGPGQAPEGKPPAAAAADKGSNDTPPGVRLRHPLAGRIEEMTVSVLKPAPLQTAGKSAPSTPSATATSPPVNNTAAAGTHTPHRTETSAVEPSAGGAKEGADEGSRSLTGRRPLVREAAKQIDLQVDSSLMAMLQRPRGPTGEGPRGLPAPPPAPESLPQQPLPFDSPELGAGLAEHVSHLLAGGGHEALIRLAPDEFGMLEVRVTLCDGQVNVAFGAAVAQTRAALEQALPQLRDLLGAAGLRLNDASIVSQLARSLERPGGLSSRASITDVPGGNSEAAGRLSGSRRTKRTDVDLYV